MVECLRRIDRYDDATGEQRAEIGDQPIDAVMRSQGNAIARCKPGIPNRTRDVFDTLEQATCRSRRPRAADALDQYVVARRLERLANELRKRLFARKLRAARDRIALHPGDFAWMYGVPRTPLKSRPLYGGRRNGRARSSRVCVIPATSSNWSSEVNA